MDRGKIIHELAMEYTRWQMKNFHDLVPEKERSAKDELESLEGFYVSAVAELSKLPLDALPL